MAVTPVEIANVADSLYQFGGEPANRSAVSRSFYAAYHAADIWQAALPGVASIAGPTGGYHQDLINKLYNGDTSWTAAQRKNGRKLSIKLNGLRTRRVIADYKLNEDLEASEILEQQVAAKEILTLCASP